MTDLAVATEGTAVRVLLHLAPAEQRDLQVLTRALERLFGQRTFSYQSQEQLDGCHCQEESLGSCTAGVQLYAQRG